ncbi:MAG: hypothetical protein H6Q66_3005 [Firmicutes bacterium]|nr:hypothetical protein [Bacillota bacterium]
MLDIEISQRVKMQKNKRTRRHNRLRFGNKE